MSTSKHDDSKDLRDKHDPSKVDKDIAHAKESAKDAKSDKEILIQKPAEMVERDRSDRAEAARKRGEKDYDDPDQPRFTPQEDKERQQKVEKMLKTEVPEDKPVVHLTVQDLLRKRRLLEDMIAGRAGDSLADRRKYAQAEIDSIDAALDKAGFAVVHGNAVPHGSTFNERTGLIDDPGKPGDRIYSKKDGWFRSQG